MTDDLIYCLYFDCTVLRWTLKPIRTNRNLHDLVWLFWMLIFPFRMGAGAPATTAGSFGELLTELKQTATSMTWFCIFHWWFFHVVWVLEILRVWHGQKSFDRLFERASVWERTEWTCVYIYICRHTCLEIDFSWAENLYLRRCQVVKVETSSPQVLTRNIVPRTIGTIVSQMVAGRKFGDPTNPLVVDVSTWRPRVWT